MVKVGVAWEENNQAVGYGIPKFNKRISQRIDHGQGVAFVICEVEINTANSLGYGQCNKILFGNDMTTAKSLEAIGVNVGEEMADIVIHLWIRQRYSELLDIWHGDSIQETLYPLLISQLVLLRQCPGNDESGPGAYT